MARPKKIEENGFNISAMVTEVPDEFVGTDNAPTRIDPSWRDYVLSFLEEDEQDHMGNPTVDGLRRLSERFVGDIMEMKPVHFDPASQHNDFTASYSVQVIYDTPIGPKIFVGTADGSGGPNGNIKGDPYNRFKPQIAETRALGRAYKQALSLRKVVTSEELFSPDQVVQTTITSTQTNALDSACKKLDLDVMRVINIGPVKFTDIKDMPREKASNLIALINRYERKEVDEKVQKAFEDRKGYKGDWR